MFEWFKVVLSGNFSRSDKLSVSLKSLNIII